MNKERVILLFIVVLSLIPRLLSLSTTPPSIANDEINIVMNSKSLMATGANIPGVVTGVIGSSSGDLSGGIHSELSSYFLIPFYIIFGFSWVTAKLPFVFASVGIVILSYLLVKKLINRDAAVFAALLSALNPWSIFFARTAYESVLSCFFYMLGIYLILSKKGWKIFYAVPFLLIGFLSYFSAKTLLLPITLSLIVGIKLMKPKISLRPIIFMNIFLAVFIFFYGFLLNLSPAGVRFKELNNNKISVIVDKNRKESLDIGFNNLFENKVVEDFRIRAFASLGTFSPTLIFLNGQPESIPSLSITDHGPLYLIDLLLIFFGIVFLTRNYLSVLYFLSLLTTVAAIPNFSNLSGTTYMIRTVILFPILTIISSIGLYYLTTLFSKKMRRFILLFFLAIYFLFFGNFLYQYFGRLSVARSEGFFLHERVASKYINLAMIKNRDVVVLSSDPKFLFYRYLFFSNLYKNPNDVGIINSKLASNIYNINNLTVLGNCLETYEANKTYIIDTKLRCKEINGLKISTILDSNDLYTIVNDRVCERVPMQDYLFIKNTDDLQIEPLLAEDFCKKFIINRNR